MSKLKPNEIIKEIENLLIGKGWRIRKYSVDNNGFIEKYIEILLNEE